MFHLLIILGENLKYESWGLCPQTPEVYRFMITKKGKKKKYQTHIVFTSFFV